MIIPYASISGYAERYNKVTRQIMRNSKRKNSLLAKQRAIMSKLEGVLWKANNFTYVGVIYGKDLIDQIIIGEKVINVK